MASFATVCYCVHCRQTQHCSLADVGLCRNSTELLLKEKEKTPPLGVNQEKLMVNPSFPLA